MTGTSTKKLHFTLDQLHKWGIDKYGHIPNQIKTRQAKLATLKNDIPTHDCIIKIKDMETNQDELLKQEELWWAQRAKAHWLKNGDLNTKYFHKKAVKEKGKIQSLTYKTIVEQLGRTVLNFTPYFLIISKIYLIAPMLILIIPFMMLSTT